ncbi:MAG: hypothetical protein Q8918_12000 [Bacteroidota bacterium]|nr:hypothetical protein [Bacteroidota bacterium]MDP4212359.1 hypothetical protein [Bacteroidota bacterium]MDP4250823.1 hypothetical protein [Bacteroidota bacterium]
MAILSDTGWSYNNSSGLAATYGEDWEVTAGQARIYVNAPDGTVYKVIGTGLGMGIGISAIPGSITSSSTSLCSTGSSIYGLGCSTLDIDDFGSFMVIYNAGAVFTIGGAAGSVAFFVHLNTLQKISLAAVTMSPMGIAGILATLTGAFKALCFFGGTEYSSPNIGADATGTAYWISSADPA